jgi:ATP-binding cassette subfamily F protein 3
MAGQRTREAQGRQKLLNRLERVEKPHTNEKTIKLRFTPEVRGGNDILQCRNLGKRYGEQQIFDGLSFDVYRQDVVGIVGPNGVGKTTLFRMILGQEQPTSGTLAVGQNLRFGYYDQELAGLNRENTIIDEIREKRPEQTPGEIRNFLGRFLFSGDEVFKVIGALSGGEQSRIMLAKLLLDNANVLLLDEPTNHLDIPAREALEAALAEYPSTIFIISHDRYLLNRLATKLLIFENGSARLFVGNYATYEAQLQEQKRLEMQERECAEQTEKLTQNGKQQRETLRVAPTSKKKKAKKKPSKAMRISEI